MKTQLIFQKDNSHKFWNITVDGNTHTVHYGRVGTDGQTKTKEFADETTALKDANKLIASKVKKGYQKVSAKPDLAASSPKINVETQPIRVVRNATTFVDKPIKELVESLIFPCFQNLTNFQKIQILEKLIR